MKKTIKFFSRTPTAIRFKQHSAVQTTSEYAGTDDSTRNVVQNSVTVPGVAELAAKVDALSAIVEKFVVNQAPNATMPVSSADEFAVSQSSEEPVPAKVAESAPIADTADTQADSENEVPEGIPDGNLGAEVPANDGKPYTDVPEDDIIKQFSVSANMSHEDARKLGLSGKETFGCLFN